ncbi:MAG: leucine-rich repeat protein [Planctomycetia bacterium]|nr:leucine-rich repeat protein [Planctomycetia bacterium]
MHPTRNELHDLVVGVLVEDKADAVLRHVEACRDCEETLRELETQPDQFVRDLQSPVSEGALEGGSAVKRLVGVVQKIGREAFSVTEQAAAGGAAEGTADLGELGQYKLLAKLGEGGMGTVYKALHTRLRRVVALKVLPAERMQNEAAVARFDREMQAVGKLNHANIVAAHDAGEVGGRHYLVMELVEGIDLSKLARQLGPLDAADACELIRQAALGLAHAHSRGMVHRDIKPSNLMLARTEEGAAIVKVMDMGLALLGQGQAVAPRELTSTGQLMGTLDYMAPEQATDTHRVDIRADIYSLGATLFKLLCGEPPFPPGDYATPLALMMAKASHEAASIAAKRFDLPPGLVAVVDKMLSRDPAKRFATPADAAEALLPFCQGANLRALLDAAIELPAIADPSAVPTRDHVTSASHETAGSVADRSPHALSSPHAPREAADQSDAPALSEFAVSAASPPERHVSRSETATSSPHAPREAAEAGAVRALSGFAAPAPPPQGHVSRSETATSSPHAPREEAASRPAAWWRKLPPKARIITIAAAAILLLSVVIVIYTADGTVEISSPDGKLPDDVTVVLKGASGTVEVSSKDNWTIKADRGEYEISLKGGNDELEVKDKRVTVRRFGKEIVTITRKPANVQPASGTAPASSADADRRAAEWVLSIGGNINIKENGQERQIGAVGDLPRAAFELTAVQLEQNSNVSDAGLANFKDCKNLTALILRGKQVSDAGLAHFKGCKHLTYLGLQDTRVSDAGLAHFKDCKSLTLLNLINTKVSDAGLAYFKDCKNLTNLDLTSTRVSDAGLAHFRDCKDLTGLGLAATQVSDAGLAHFQKCKNLTHLNLDQTRVTDAGLAHLRECKNLTGLYLNAMPVTDAGLAHFKDCKNLTYLHLAGTPVTDAGLAHFQDCKNLAALGLGGTQVTDAGLAHFQDCKNLTALYLGGTRVSDAGLADLASLPGLTGLDLVNTRISLGGFEQLKAAMPKCQITWSEPNRAVAESVLALGGSVEIGARDKLESRAIQAAGELPRDYFQVRRVSLAGVAKPLEKLPEQLSLLTFPEFDRLESIDLSHVSGLSYDFLASIHGLKELSLAGSGLNDDALAKLPKLATLKRLVLDGNEIRGRGLSSLAAQPELVDLSLACPSITDLFAEHLAALKQVKRLSLAGSGLGDEGIKHLTGLTKLEQLDLKYTKVTADGVKKLHDALPQCRIESDHGTFGPPIDSDRRAAEWVLSIGGTVRVNDEERDIQAVAELSQQSFRLTAVNLYQNRQVTDAGLACFDRCRNLASLNLGETSVSDAGLAHFKECNGLKVLFLRLSQKVTDVGLAHFQDCTNLAELYLSATQATDAGLAHFKDCKNLTVLGLDSTKVTDAGLAYFKDCTKLAVLGLYQTQVGDAGLAQFKDCKELTGLELHDTKLTDAGLAHFQGCKKLRHLSLQGCQVSDAGLSVLAGLAKLETLGLKRTKVTAAGVAELQKALPKCQIEWDGKKDQ